MAEESSTGRNKGKTAEAEDVSEAVDGTVVDDAPEQEETPESQPAAKDGKRRKGLSVFAGLLLGGALAALIGFGAARTIVPEGWPFPGVTPEPDPLAVALSEQQAALASLETHLKDFSTRLGALESDTRLEQLGADLAEAKVRIGALADMVNAIDGRLAAVEKIPQGSSNEAAEAAARAYERELVAIRKMLDIELAQIRAAQEAANADNQSAEQAAQEATTRAALAQLVAALDSGQPFDGALAKIAELTGRNPPPELAEAARAGVVTLNDLQGTFPQAARAALSASVSALVAEGKIGRFEGFMRSQLGTRSLEPKPGDDPDAVLSRAEAALKQGDIDTALREIAALPEAGRSAMADWAAMAQSRLAAQKAIEALTAELNSQ